MTIDVIAEDGSDVDFCGSGSDVGYNDFVFVGKGLVKMTDEGTTKSKVGVGVPVAFFRIHGIVHDLVIQEHDGGSNRLVKSNQKCGRKCGNIFFLSSIVFEDDVTPDSSATFDGVRMFGVNANVCDSCVGSGIDACESALCDVTCEVFLHNRTDNELVDVQARREEFSGCVQFCDHGLGIRIGADSRQDDERFQVSGRRERRRGRCDGDRGRREGFHGD